MAPDVRVPEMGESIVEATIGRWLRAEGDRVSAGEPLVELETEKTNLEISAERTGTLEKVLKREGETVSVSEVIATISEESGTDRAEAEPRDAGKEEAGTSAAPEAGAGTAATEQRQRADQLHATPLARNLAQEHGIDLAQVEGTGPGGRISKEDVEAVLRRKEGEREAREPRQREREAPPATRLQEAPSPFAAPLADGQAGRSEERLRLSRRRLTIARRLTEAQQTTASTTTYNEADMSGIVEIRRRHRESFRQRHGVDLGLMPFFVKAVVTALRDFPELNSELQDDELVLKYYYNIGIAVASDEGLVVPVLSRADALSFAEIEADIQGMVERTRSRKLTLEELRDGTFTITNGGVFGSLLSTPLLNPPQVGILGMHRIEERPVAIEGQVVVRPMMYIALTYDHRVVDGHRGVQFLNRVKALVEEPALLMVDA